MQRHTHLVKIPSDYVGYTVCDFIHERISVGAQYALFRLYQRGDARRMAALKMLAAVRSQPNRLRGVFRQDMGEPARLALANQTAWWNLLPEEDGARVGAALIALQDPPMVVYNRKLEEQTDPLADALYRAWRDRSVEVDQRHIPSPRGTPCTGPPPPRPKPEAGGRAQLQIWVTEDGGW